MATIPCNFCIGAILLLHHALCWLEHCLCTSFYFIFDPKSVLQICNQQADLHPHCIVAYPSGRNGTRTDWTSQWLNVARPTSQDWTFYPATFSLCDAQSVTLCLAKFSLATISPDPAETTWIKPSIWCRRENNPERLIYYSKWLA